MSECTFVVEDELHLSEALSHILKKTITPLMLATTVKTGLDDALSGIYDVIVLDIMLPKMDGITVLKTLRSEGFDTPVILLTAKNEISDKVLGLDSGADDYLAKPFNTEELLARISALGRRRGEIVANTNTISYGDITLNTSSLKLTAGASEITLTLKESELLEHLMLHKEMVLFKGTDYRKIMGFLILRLNPITLKYIYHFSAKTCVRTLKGVH